MALGMTLSAVTATSATFAFTGVAADGTIEVQIGPRPDFELSIAPIYKTGLGPNITMSGLNQRSTLFARARMRRASQAIEGGWTDVIGLRTLDDTAQIITPASVMIEPAMLIVPERLLGFTPSGAVAGFPIENLGRDSPVAYRSAVAGGTFSFNVRTAGAPIDTVALLNTNIPEAATILVRGANTEAALTSGPQFTTVAAPFRASLNLPQRNGYHSLVRLGSLQAYPWWRIIIANALTPGSPPMMHAEHLILGRNRMSKNHSLDKKETPAPLGTLERRRSGAPDRIEGLVMRKVDFDLSNLTEAQYETAYADLIYRESLPVFCIPNSKGGAFLHDRMLYGDLSGGGVTNPYSPRYTRSFSISSLI